MVRTAVLRIKRWLPLFVPPVVSIGLRRLHAGQHAEYEFAGHRWPTEKVFRGWDVESVASRHERGWRQLDAAVSGSGPLTENGVVAHNTLMCVGYALGRALQGRSSVSMLDWGGGAGEYGLIARGMYPDAEIDYCCRELPKLAELGCALLPHATFFDCDEAALSRTYDFVLVSASLHYTPDWALLLRRLAGVADAYVFVTRQPFVDKVTSYVAVQHPNRSGYYDTEYPGWVLNRNEFLQAAGQSGLRLVREVVSGEQPFIRGAPEQPVYRGFLFQAGRHP